MLNASTEDTRDSIRKAADVYDIDFPIMVDETQLVAESLKVNKAGEVLVINPATMRLLYRGPLDRVVASGGDDGVAQAVPVQPLASVLAKAVAGEAINDTVT
ncbi:MAG TPA: hypothetical protein VNA21_16555, partial [Steroidobacteraceae bacterium]|nr:hypothetical protein [Steroidobacteraceae bacterium]